MEHVARQYPIQGRHKRIYKMYSESTGIFKFTLDLGFIGIANIVNSNILVLIFYITVFIIHIYMYSVFYILYHFVFFIFF